MCLENIISETENQTSSWEINQAESTQPIVTDSEGIESGNEARKAGAPGRWKGEGKDSLLETPEGMQPSQHLCF